MANGIDIDVGQSILVGPQGPIGPQGPRGYGVVSTTKTGTSGLVDTYTITYEDGRTNTIEVTNGRAISSIDLTSTVENVDTYTITYNDGTTSTFTVTNSNVSREEFEEAVELTNSEMDDAEVEGEKLKLKGVATTNLGITVQGNTYQETTSGKNKLLLPNQSITHSGVTMTTYEDGRLVIDGAATGTVNTVGFVLPNPIAYTSNKQYTFSLTYVSGSATNLTGVTTINLKKGIIGESSYGDFISISNIQNDYAQNFSKSITTADENSVTRLQFISYLSDQVFNNLTYKLQLEESSEATDFEPFTNGPSHNPDYPQEIQVVTGENEVQIQGKNYIDLTKHTNTLASNTTILNSNSYQCDLNGSWKGEIVVPIENLKPNTDYVISANVDSSATYSIITYIRGYNGSDYTELVSNSYFDYFKNGLNFNSGEYERYVLKMFIVGNQTRTGIEKLEDLQIEEDVRKTSFEPYIGANYPISLGSIELAKIGNYKDYIHKSGTDWFVHKEIDKIILDGTQTISGFSTHNGTTYITANFDNSSVKKVPNSNMISNFSNKLVGATGNQTWQGQKLYSVSQQPNGKYLQICLPYSVATTSTELSTWLASNNILVYYILETPTEEQITDTTLIQQLEALNQAAAKGNDFTITTETENLKPVLKVEYKESTRYKADDLENRVEKLEEQIKHAGHVYGVRRKRENNSSSEWERTDDAIGLVANATHDGTEVQNDFDNLSPWKDIISFNLDLETGHKKAYYGDPDFAFDGNNGDVYTHIPDIYYRVWHDDEYDYVQIADFAESEFEKCDKFDIQRYKTGMVNNVLHSYSNISPATSRNITSFRVLTQEIGQDYCLLDWRYFVIQLLYLVEYANYNSQAMLGKGFSSMRNNVADVSLLAEANTHRFVVNTNAGNDFIVGQTVCVGTSLGQYDIAENRKITAITDYDEGGITGKIITLNGAAFSTTITSVIWSGAQPSGQCDSLGMKSGCLADDGKHEVIYRGIEDIYGNIHHFVDGINLKDRRAYICYDPAEYVSDKFEEPYEAIEYVNGTSNGYAKTLGFDINQPLIQLPIKTGGSNNTGICDYYYQDGGNRIVRVGGTVNTGYNNGLWYWSLNGGLSSAGWNCGARVIKYK